MILFEARALAQSSGVRVCHPHPIGAELLGRDKGEKQEIQATMDSEREREREISPCKDALTSSQGDVDRVLDNRNQLVCKH